MMLCQAVNCLVSQVPWAWRGLEIEDQEHLPNEWRIMVSTVAGADFEEQDHCESSPDS